MTTAAAAWTVALVATRPARRCLSGRRPGGADRHHGRGQEVVVRGDGYSRMRAQHALGQADDAAALDALHGLLRAPHCPRRPRVLDAGANPDRQRLAVRPGQQPLRRVLDGVAPLLALVLVRHPGRWRPQIADAFGRSPRRSHTASTPGTRWTASLMRPPVPDQQRRRAGAALHRRRTQQLDLRRLRRRLPPRRGGGPGIGSQLGLGLADLLQPTEPQAPSGAATDAANGTR